VWFSWHATVIGTFVLFTKHASRIAHAYIVVEVPTPSRPSLSGIVTREASYQKSG
jgi:hypothetical protein